MASLLISKRTVTTTHRWVWSCCWPGFWSGRWGGPGCPPWFQTWCWGLNWAASGRRAPTRRGCQAAWTWLQWRQWKPGQCPPHPANKQELELQLIIIRIYNKKKLPKQTDKFYYLLHFFFQVTVCKSPWGGIAMLLKPGSVVFNSHSLGVGIVEGWNVMRFHITTKNLFGQLVYIAKNRGRRTCDGQLNSLAAGTVQEMNVKMPHWAQSCVGKKHTITQRTRLHIPWPLVWHGSRGRRRRPAWPARTWGSWYQRRWRRRGGSCCSWDCKRSKQWPSQSQGPGQRRPASPPAATPARRPRFPARVQKRNKT